MVARTSDDLKLVADLTKHPAWQALKRAVEDSIEKESVRLAKELRTADYEIDVAALDRERAYWRGMRDAVNQPLAALRKLDRDRARQPKES